MSQEKGSFIARSRLTGLALPLVIGSYLVSTLACAREPDSEPPARTTPPPAPTPPSQPPPVDTAPSIPLPPPTLPADTGSAPGAAGWTIGISKSDKPLVGSALLRDVRAARHPTFDRIVFEFAPPVGLPGYHIEYVDRPVTQCGSGETVPLPGDAWLEVRFQPADAHDQEGRPTAAPRSRRPGLPNLLGLDLICDFEAHVNWVAAVRLPTRYRVLELGQPARLIVDVLHR